MPTGDPCGHPTPLCQPINPHLLPGSSTHFFSWHTRRMGFLLPPPWHCRGHQPCQHPVPDLLSSAGVQQCHHCHSSVWQGRPPAAGVEAAFPASSVCVPAEELPRQPQCLPAASSPAVSTSPTHTENPSQAPSHKSLLKQACRLRWVPRHSNGVSFACPRSSASSRVLLQSQAGAGGPGALLQCRQARWPGWRSCRSRCTHRGSPGLWLRSPHRGTGIYRGQNCVG